MTMDDGHLMTTTSPHMTTGTDIASSVGVPSGSSGGSGESVTEKGKTMAHEAKNQVSSLLDQARGEVRQQAQSKGQEMSQSLRRVSDQLMALSQGRPEEAGPAQKWLTSAQTRVQSMADKLESGGPQALMGDVKGFARRRPGVFLFAAAGAGFALARMTRATASASGGTPAPPMMSDGMPHNQMPDGYATTSTLGASGASTTGLPPSEMGVTGVSV